MRWQSAVQLSARPERKALSAGVMWFTQTDGHQLVGFVFNVWTLYLFVGIALCPHGAGAHQEVET